MDGATMSGLAAPSGDYRALFEQSVIPTALVMAKTEPRFVAASRGFLEIFGLPRSALVGRSLGEVLAPQGRSDLTAAIARCLATSESGRSDVELRDSGNSRRFIGLAVHNARARGFANHVIVEAEGRGHAVHSAEQRLSSLIDQAERTGKSMTYLHDLKSHRVRYVDGGLARRIGLSGGAAREQDLLSRVHPDDLGTHRVYEGTRETLADHEFATQTLRVRDLEGQWRLVSFRSHVLRRDSKGAARLMIGTATDITDNAGEVTYASGAALLYAEQNERARIGRELHDSTAQHLVAADLGLARVLRSGGLSADDRERLEGVQTSLATAQTEMRAFAYFLHPPELRELGLLRTLEKFCAGFARRSGLEIAFTSQDLPAELSSDAEHALFRVCQEALMNVYRHAFARRVSVSLSAQDERLSLEVRDDGIGVDGVDRFEHGGMGVAGMRSRMASVGGDLTLDYLGPGLAVRARAPLQQDHWGR